APGGIPDYCERYGASLSRLSAADPSIYEGENLSRILRQWKALDADQVAARMQWREPRLAALKVHKRPQTDSGKTTIAAPAGRDEAGSARLCWLCPCRPRCDRARVRHRSTTGPCLSSCRSDRRCGRRVPWRESPSDKECAA